MSEKQFEEILERLDRIEVNTRKMADHIDFVNKAYDKYKSGFDFVHSMFSPKRDSSTTKPE